MEISWYAHTLASLCPFMAWSSPARNKGLMTWSIHIYLNLFQLFLHGSLTVTITVTADVTVSTAKPPLQLQSMFRPQQRCAFAV